MTVHNISLDIPGALTAGATGGATARWEATSNGEISFADALVATAPTGSGIVVDVLKNGTSVYGTPANRPTIAAGATTSQNPGLPAGTQGAPTPGAFNTIGATAQNNETPTSSVATGYTATKFVQGDVLTLSVVSVGTTVAGSDLSVSVAVNV
jgi:hypothetical protein